MVIAVIGGIASGKSFVIRFFSDKGLPVLEADKIAHRFLEKESPLYPEIVRKFGSEILDKDNNIVRSLLARKVFSNDEKREWLNDMIHPLVYQCLSSEIKKLKSQGKKDIVLEIPLLTSNSILPEINNVVLVTSTKELQIERLKEKKLSKAEIDNRLRAQVPIDEQIKIADYIINNDGTPQELEASLDELWEILQSDWK